MWEWSVLVRYLATSNIATINEYLIDFFNAP
jgi:hypothetical protein